MTKDQEYKILFESWNNYVQENTKTQSQEKQDLVDFINNNKVNLTADRVVDHLKANYQNLSDIDKPSLDQLKSDIGSILSSVSSLDYSNKENVEKLATQILNQADQAYSKTVYTDTPTLSSDEMFKMRKKAQEKFALGDRTLTKAEMAALAATGAAAAAAKVAGPVLAFAGIKKLGGWFVGKIRKLFPRGKDPDLTAKFGKGAAGGKAAAETIKNAGGKNSLKWAANKAMNKTTTKAGLKLTAKTVGKRALAFLGPVGAAAAGAWLLYDLYDTFYADNKKVDEGIEKSITQKDIDEKILKHIEDLKKDQEFWKAFTSEIGKEIDQIQKTVSAAKVQKGDGEYVNHYHKIKGRSPEAKEKRKQERETIRAIAAKTQERFPKDWKQDSEFLNKVRSWCDKHGVPMQNILALMYHETAFTMSPGKVGFNGCTGLIMFCPNSGMQMIKKDGRQLAAMTRAEQWDYVEMFLDKNNKWKQDPKNIASLYLAVFLPAFAGLPDDAVIASKFGKSDPKLHPRVKRFSDNEIKAWWKQNPANRDRSDKDRITKSGLKPILSRYISKVSPGVISESKIVKIRLKEGEVS